MERWKDEGRVERAGSSSAQAVYDRGCKLQARLTGLAKRAYSPVCWSLCMCLSVCLSSTGQCEYFVIGCVVGRSGTGRFNGRLAESDAALRTPHLVSAVRN